MYIRKIKVGVRVYYQVVEKVNGKLVVVKHLGNLNNIIKVFSFYESGKDTNSYPS